MDQNPITPDGEGQSGSESPNYSTPTDIDVFGGIVDMYEHTVIKEVGILTGLSDFSKISEITVAIFVRLWECRYEQIKPCLLLRRVLIQQVFTYLMETGNNSRIKHLQANLSADPSWHSHIITQTNERI